MSDLVQEISPLTRALVWLRPEEISAKNEHYRSIDYLLDGLLTATLRENPKASALLVGKNFNRNIYVFAASAKPSAKELDSFFSLLEKDLGNEDRILIVDDVEGRESFLGYLPKKLLPHIHVIKG
jgi:hypothetical protein